MKCISSNGLVKKWTFLIGGAVAIAFLTIVVFIPDIVATSRSLPWKSTSGIPVRLKIPAIGVDAAVVPVGLDKDGAMVAPKGPSEVAWFNLGPLPGQNGSAVIAGHFGWKDNIPAVFDSLNELKKGDTILVENDEGRVTAFVVRESRTFGEDENAESVFASSDGKAHVNLITCGGVWNTVEKKYSNRLVVFADAK